MAYLSFWERFYLDPSPWRINDVKFNFTTVAVTTSQGKADLSPCINTRVMTLCDRMIAHEKVAVIDVDGTLADQRESGQSYADVKVLPSVAQKVRSLKNRGYWIILYTSRNMRTYGGNIGQIMCHTAPILVEWLARHKIPYDELHFGKPWCGHDGFYVDDRAIRPREFVTMDLDEIEALFRRDRLSDE